MGVNSPHDFLSGAIRKISGIEVADKTKEQVQSHRDGGASNLIDKEKNLGKL